jgi:hypothetical protein
LWGPAVDILKHPGSTKRESGFSWGYRAQSLIEGDRSQSSCGLISLLAGGGMNDNSRGTQSRLHRRCFRNSQSRRRNGEAATCGIDFGDKGLWRPFLFGGSAEAAEDGGREKEIYYRFTGVMISGRARRCRSGHGRSKYRCVGPDVVQFAA